MRVIFASLVAVLSVALGMMALVHFGVLQPQSLGLNLHRGTLLAQAFELAHRRDAMTMVALGLVLVIVWGKVAASVGSKR